MKNLNEAFGWDKYLKPFLYKKLPSKTGWSAVLGTLSALTFIIMVLTGMVLAMYYVPSPDKAWDSVQYITNEIPCGSILRGLHHWGAGAMVLLVFLHLVINYLHGSYIRPRQWTWVTGACLFLVVLGLGFTGYLLPWDMKAYWATIVGSNIPSQYPLIGEGISHFILGGDGMSGFTLSRFFAVHVLVLPAFLLLFLAMHIYLIRVHNLSDPRERVGGEELPPEDDAKPYRFFPEHMTRTAIAFGLFFIVLFYLAATVPAHLDPKAGTFIADFLPRPEWYYLWLFQLLTYFTGSWEAFGSLVLPVGGIILLFGVPFFSESRIKGIMARPVSLAIMATMLIAMVYLSWQAVHEARPYKEIAVVPERALNDQEQRGLYLYTQNQCSYCHNIKGMAGHRKGPDLSNVVAKDRTTEYLTQYIRDPKQVVSYTSMPEYKLKDADLKALAAYLLSLDFSSSNRPVILQQADVLKKGAPQ